MRLSILILGAFFGLTGSRLYATEPQEAAYAVIGELACSVLAEPGKTCEIESFDLSPDGTRLALLYELWKTRDGVPENAEIRVTLWDIATQKIVRGLDLARNDLPPPTRNSDARRPAFDENAMYALMQQRGSIIYPDQNFMIAMALGRVWVIDANALSTIRSIDLPRPQHAVPVRIQTVGGSVLAVVYQDGLDHFRVGLFDLASGKELTEWPSTVVPDSFSPDGKLAAAPDPDKRNGGGVAGVQLLDSRNGAKLKSIPVGFGFKRTRFGEPSAYGVAVSRFLSSEQIVVTPSADRDRSGRRSGNGFEIIDIARERVTGEITPPKFGPTGVLVVSGDRKHFAVESVYAPPFWIAFESLNPKHYTHSVLLFSGETDTLEATIPISSAKAGGNVSLRLSMDASTMAIRFGEAVQILHMK